VGDAVDRIEDLSFRLEGRMGDEPCNDVMDETQEQVDMGAPGVLISFGRGDVCGGRAQGRKSHATRFLVNHPFVL